MPTYDYTMSSDSTTAKMLGYASQNSFHVLKRKFDVPTVIAWDTTLAADAKITSGDIFELLPVPDDTMIFNGGCKIITLLGACTSVDFGTAGGVQIISARDFTSATSTAGNHYILLVGSTWGADNLMGYVFTSADSLDIQFNADETTGELLFYAFAADVADDEGTD